MVGFTGTGPSGEYFSAEWRGRLEITIAGLYSFTAGSDDGSRVFIDGNQVLDNGGFYGYEEVIGSVTLSSGFHEIIVEYYQGGGGKWLNFFWQGPDSGDTREKVPV